MKHEIASRMKRLALDTIELIESLPKTETRDVICRQLIRSVTSVGANYRAACRARSRADFIAKITIAEEEADESQYWLELLRESGLISEERFGPLYKEADELTAILVASGRTAKENRT